MTTANEPDLCPECRDGKHPNCTQQTLNDDDTWVPCECQCQRTQPCTSTAWTPIPDTGSTGHHPEYGSSPWW